MVAPGWQNKKKKTLKSRDSSNKHALKKARGLKATHDAMKARLSGVSRTGKQRRKAVKVARRAMRDKEKAAAEGVAEENLGLRKTTKMKTTTTTTTVASSGVVAMQE